MIHIKGGINMKKNFKFTDEKNNTIIVRFHTNGLLTFAEIYFYKLKCVKKYGLSTQKLSRNTHHIYTDYINADESHFYFGSYDGCKKYVKKYLKENFNNVKILSSY